MRKQVCEAGESPKWIQQGLLPGSTAPSLQSHHSGALTNVGWQYAWTKDAEVQRHHAYCPILTQFSSSLRGALVKWTARDHQTNVSLYLLSLNLILLTSSYLKNWKKKRKRKADCLRKVFTSTQICRFPMVEHCMCYTVSDNLHLWKQLKKYIAWKMEESSHRLGMHSGELQGPNMVTCQTSGDAFSKILNLMAWPLPILFLARLSRFWVSLCSTSSSFCNLLL